MEQPRLSGIRIYPIKSLDPVVLQEAEIGVHSLKHDRTFALLTADGKYVNGKRTGRVNQLKAEYDLPNGNITLSTRGEDEKHAFKLEEGNPELLEYLSDFFEMPVILVHRQRGELMDVPTRSSATVVSQASIESLQNDLPNHSTEDLRLRFRHNIEISGVEAFWEEQLFRPSGEGIRFAIGDVEMVGMSPRARCNVPPRNPLTGKTDKQFIKAMLASRTKTLPANSFLPEYGNLYYFTVDTHLAEKEAGKVIKVGDPIKILNEMPSL